MRIDQQIIRNQSP